MKTVTFTARCDGIGSVFNPGDVAVFPDDIADTIVEAEKGTAKPFEVTLPPDPKKGTKVDPAPDKPPEGATS